MADIAVSGVLVRESTIPGVLLAQFDKIDTASPENTPYAFGWHPVKASDVVLDPDPFEED